MQLSSRIDISLILLKKSVQFGTQLCGCMRFRKCKVNVRKTRRKEQVLTNCENEMILCGIVCVVKYVATDYVKTV